nr:MAG TPA: hypothetical protein [Caudoviricetes sp.]
MMSAIGLLTVILSLTKVICAWSGSSRKNM